MFALQRYEDGQEWLEEITNVEYETLKISGHPVLELPESFWEKYQEHVRDCKRWSKVLYGLFVVTLNDRW